MVRCTAGILRTRCYGAGPEIHKIRGQASVRVGCLVSKGTCDDNRIRWRCRTPRRPTVTQSDRTEYVEWLPRADRREVGVKEHVEKGSKRAPPRRPHDAHHFF